MSKLSVLLLCVVAATLCSTCQKKDSEHLKIAIIGSWYQEGANSPTLHIQFVDDGTCNWYDSTAVKHTSTWSIDNACLYFNQSIGQSTLGTSPSCITSIQHQKMIGARFVWKKGEIDFSNGTQLLEE